MWAAGEHAWERLTMTMGEEDVVPLSATQVDQVVPAAEQSWVQDGEMWEDLLELLRMEGDHDTNPNAVRIFQSSDGDSASGDGGVQAAVSGSEEERREARIVARREARREAKARHDYWYKHAHPDSG
jgi:hypothetical protein